MDETYIKVMGSEYTYTAVDNEGDIVEFLIAKRRNKLAANKFLVKGISNNGSRPKVINIDKRVERTRSY